MVKVNKISINETSADVQKDYLGWGASVDLTHPTYFWHTYNQPSVCFTFAVIKCDKELDNTFNVITQ